jgi:UDP-N-acetylglucosamine 2-epimerase
MILNDPILLAAHRAENLGYQKLIRDCLQAIMNLEDIVYPTRPRVNLERDGYEIRSGNVGWITSIDRF